MTEFFCEGNSFNQFFKASTQSFKLIFLAEPQVKIPCCNLVIKFQIQNKGVKKGNHCTNFEVTFYSVKHSSIFCQMCLID